MGRTMNVCQDSWLRTSTLDKKNVPDTTKATSTTTTRSRSRSDSDIGDLLFEDEDEILYPSSSNGGASTESGIVERSFSSSDAYDDVDVFVSGSGSNHQTLTGSGS